MQKDKSINDVANESGNYDSDKIENVLLTGIIYKSKVPKCISLVLPGFFYGHDVISDIPTSKIINYIEISENVEKHKLVQLVLPINLKLNFSSTVSTENISQSLTSPILDHIQTPTGFARQTPTGFARQTPTGFARQTPTGFARQTPTGFARQTPTGFARQTPTGFARQAPGKMIFRSWLYY